MVGTAIEFCRHDAARYLRQWKQVELSRSARVVHLDQTIQAHEKRAKELHVFMVSDVECTGV